MSTILKTLKKLEEEKSVLDQKLNLKEMVLKDDSVYPKPVENEYRRFSLIAIMVTGALIATGVAVYYWTPTHKVPTPSRLTTSKTPEQQIPLPKSLPKPRTFEGVSMAGVASNERETMAKSEQSFTFFKQLVTKLPAAESTLPKQLPSKKPLHALLPKKVASPAVSSDLGDIGNLIQSATTSGKNSLSASKTIQSGHIPGLKVKGIIFFDEKHLSNHIIVTTPNNSNLKLRKDDPVQNAVIKSIHPNHVIFSYQDQLIKIGIGQ